MNSLQKLFSALLLSLPIAFLAASANQAELKSGLRKGNLLLAFEPYHVTGPDAGTFTCPVCKYGQLPTVQLWVNHETEQNLVAEARILDKAVQAHKNAKLNAFIIFLKPKATSDSEEKRKLKAISQLAKVTRVSFLYTEADDDFVKPYHLNGDSAVRTTLLVAKKRRVIENVVNMAPGDPRLGHAITSATR